MQTIKKHIQEGNYSLFYLIYGEDSYLKRLYRDKLKHAILGDDDGMNFNYFEGNTTMPESILEIGQTMPFFADRRLIIVENSGFFHSASTMPDLLDAFADTTVVVFVEQDVDKRGRLYKAVNKSGTVALMDGLEGENLRFWILTKLKPDQKKITRITMNYLIDKVGSDLELLDKELEKLLCYTMGKEVITEQDIDAVCTTQISNHIFQLTDAIAEGKQIRAMYYLDELFSLRERPMGILFLVIRHYNILLQLEELVRKNPGAKNAELASKVGVPPFTIGKYRNQLSRYTYKKLHAIVEDCIDGEERFKTGRMDEQLALETLVIRYSSV